MSWIEQQGARAGSWIYLTLPELGVYGQSQVLGIDACPPIESGYGRVVLGTFVHASRDVYELKLVGQDEPIGVTYGHPIWSLDRGGWVGAGELRVGERLATADGEAVVESLTADPRPVTLYNLDIEEDHRFLVGAAGLVVHNAGPAGVSRASLTGRSRRRGNAFECRV